MDATSHTHSWPVHSLVRLQHELRREFHNASADMIARAIALACTLMTPAEGSHRLHALARKELALLLALARGARHAVTP